MGEALPYPRDTERYKWFNAESAEHGAKMEIRSFIRMVELYTEPGQILLDPMSGTGTIHIAATMGRHTNGCEIVPRFQEIQLANIEELKKSPGLTGLATMLPGDLRLYMPLPVDAIIFSPPYGVTFSTAPEDAFKAEKGIRRSYGTEAGIIGNGGNYMDYLIAMEIVYRLCNQSLKLGGIMVFVTKDYVVAGERVMVTMDNLRCALNAGFMPVDIHQREVQDTILQNINKKRRAKSGQGDRVDLVVNTEEFVVVKKAREL